MKQFKDLEIGDKMFSITEEDGLRISEIKDIYLTYNGNIEYTLIPIIGDWSYLWLSKEEDKLTSLWDNERYFTADENDAIKVFKNSFSEKFWQFMSWR